MEIKVADKRRWDRRVKMTIQEVMADWGRPDMVAEAEARVEKGMAWLDEHQPDWFDKFMNQMDEFDLANAEYCVCGLVFGDYFKVVKAKGLEESLDPELPNIEPQEAFEMGFSIWDGDGGSNGRPPPFLNWSRLQRAWSFKVEQRLGIDHYRYIV